jgi:predicted DNA-binding transcriptional regulator AlpA
MTTPRSGHAHSSRPIRALVGIDEAALLLGEDRSTVYRSIKRGDFPLPVVTINGRMRLPRRAIEALVTGAPGDAAPARDQASYIRLRLPKADLHGQQPADLRC